MGTMAKDNVSGSSMTETAVSSLDFDITNKDVYEFYKIHKGSKNSSSITCRFLNHFSSQYLSKSHHSVWEPAAKKIRRLQWRLPTKV